MPHDKPSPSLRDKVTHYYPIDVITKAKALYLNKCLQPRDISAKLKLPHKTVVDWAHRYGWAKIRRERFAKLDQKIESIDISDDFLRTVAIESEEIALSGFARARESADSDSEYAAKDFASWTSGTKNLVAMYRTAKGLDGSGNNNTQINLSISSFYAPPPQPVPTKPIKTVSGDSIPVDCSETTNTD